MTGTLSLLLSTGLWLENTYIGERKKNEINLMEEEEGEEEEAVMRKNELEQKEKEK